VPVSRTTPTTLARRAAERGGARIRNKRATVAALERVDGAALDAQFTPGPSDRRELSTFIIGDEAAGLRSVSWRDAGLQLEPQLGTQKLRRLAELERHVVVVHISDPGVRQAYAELSTLAQSSGWSLLHGKNDLWIGVAAHATDKHLLTMATDFLPRRGRAALWHSNRGSQPPI